MPATVDSAQIAALARVALANVASEYPFNLVHLARRAAELDEPHRLHPAFFGAYDWHSSVHMHWTLARCLRLAPGRAPAAMIADHLDARLTPAAIENECDYFATPGRGAFERPYGWGWLLQLWVELDVLATLLQTAARWRDALTPLADLLTARMIAWLPRAEYPVRAGTHGNSAFALILALHYARRRANGLLSEAIMARARLWFGADRAYPADYEPGGDDFLSGGLCEALLMARVLPADEWPDWWHAFSPPAPAMRRWLTPVDVADSTDAKIVHLHGLNLSRVWCWRQLRQRLPAPLQAPAEQAAQEHLRTSLAAATTGDYVGTHWLASFALLALTGDSHESS